MPATITLAEGAECWLFVAPDDGAFPHDAETASVGVRDSAGTPVAVRRSDGGLVIYPSPDDPAKRVAFLGSFTAAVPGSYAITVDGSPLVYVTDIPPEWRHEHPLAGIAAELPRNAAVLAVAGILLLALALRQPHRAA
jgi:hypothetical protein